MKRITFLFFTGCLLMMTRFADAQQVIITDDASYTSPAGGAMLDVKSTSKGFLPPRVALTKASDASTIASPSTGLIVYNTATNGTTSADTVRPGYYYNAGTSGTPNWCRLTNSDSLNGMSFQYDGSPILNGTATVWDDLRISLNTRYSGNTVPGLTGFAGSSSLLAYYFTGGTQMQEIFFEVQMPHSWKEGTTIYPHVHWSPGDATSGNVVWRLEYTWANYEGTYPSSTTISTTQAAAGTAWTSQIAPFSGMDGSGKKISSMLYCRLFRDPNGSDTYSGNAFLLGFDVHFEINSFGSRLEYIK